MGNNQLKCGDVFISFQMHVEDNDQQITIGCLTTYLKDALSGLRQLLKTESPLKTMKDIFLYFTLKSLLILKIIKFDFLGM